MYPKKEERLTLLPYDILSIILQFLSYSERTIYLRLCRLMKGIPFDRFTGYQIHTITWPGRSDVSYLFVHHPYSTPCLHPYSYLGHNYIAFIMYDTSYSYYHIRCMRPYEEGKTLQEYLSEYEPSTYYINRVMRFTALDSL